MVNVVLRSGTRFFDPKNRSIVYVLEGGMASGRSILVAQNPVSKAVTTTIVGNRVISNRFIPFP